MAYRAERKSGAITLLEAFRRILRALYPQRPELADEIKSWLWFWYYKSNSVPEAEYEAACSALEKLDAERCAGRIRLQGSLECAPPADIHTIDAKAPRFSLDPEAVAGFSEFGDLDVFPGTLAINRKGIPQRTYDQVHALEDDVDAIVREIAGTSTVEQPSTDQSEAGQESPLQPQRKIGRPPAADWDGIVRQQLFARLDYFGPPSPDDDDPNWRRRADAERVVAGICEGRGWSVAESVVREHTSRLITEWKRLRWTAEAGK